MGQISKIWVEVIAPPGPPVNAAPYPDLVSYIGQATTPRDLGYPYWDSGGIPMAFAAADLPTGLSMDSGGIVAPGIPTVLGDTTVAVTATSSQGNSVVDGSFIWSVVAAPIFSGAGAGNKLNIGIGIGV